VAPGRDYVFSSPDPLWAFGHGLSYTQFDYLKAETDKTQYQPNDTISVKVLLKNSGFRTGKEVVQAYVHDVVSSVMTPVLQLKGFQKVELQPQEIKEVLIQIPVHELELTDNSGNRYLEAGEFEIKVGSASDNILFTKTVYVGEEQEKTSSSSQRPQTGALSEGKKITIKGFIRDIQATPVADVCISNGTATPTETISDEKGYYEITGLSNGNLYFTKKGFQPQSITINNQTQINIQLTKGNK
jgi:hypothetical protein